MMLAHPMLKCPASFRAFLRLNNGFAPKYCYSSITSAYNTFFLPLIPYS